MFVNDRSKNLTGQAIENLPVGSCFYHNGNMARKVSETKGYPDLAVDLQ